MPPSWLTRENPRIQHIREDDELGVVLARRKVRRPRVRMMMFFLGVSAIAAALALGILAISVLQ